jgi:hypothetical protein
MKEFEFIENKGMREEFVRRMEVLDKVGNLLLLPNTEYATTEQVAEYYKTTAHTIEGVINRNKDELISDGYSLQKRSDVIQFLNIQDIHLKSKQGRTIATLENNDNIIIPNRGLRLFTKRAILRVGMLLRDSEVAKEVRTTLLNVYHDAEQGKTDIIDNIVKDIDEEKQLMMDRVEAEMKGDFDAVCVVNAKLFALKNKRIAELESEKDFINSTRLTISESRDVINRIVRKIAMSHFNGNFGNAYNELYSKVNYKLHINVNNRKEVGLKRFTDTEIIEIEKIVRSWASDLGFNTEELLKLSV